MGDYTLYASLKILFLSICRVVGYEIYTWSYYYVNWYHWIVSIGINMNLFCIYSYFVSYICMYQFHLVYSFLIHIYDFHVLNFQLAHIFKKSTKFMMENKIFGSLCLPLISKCFNFIFVKMSIGINMFYKNDYFQFGILKFVCFTKSSDTFKNFF